MTKRNYDDFIEAYLKYTDNHESTKRIQLWTIMSVLAGALERKVWINRGYYTLFPNLYVFIIAKSGLVKKSTSTAIGVNLLREIEGIKFMSERLTAASLIKQMSNAFNTFEVGIKEYKQCSLYCYGSELAVTMGEVYGSIIELLTTFFDCQPNDSTKPWINKAAHDEPIKIYGPCLNMLGASTKEWLSKAIPDKEMMGGFASRAVFVVENSGPPKLVAWPEITPDIETMKANLISDLYEIYNLKGEFTITPQVKSRFTDWYKYHMEEVIPRNHDPRFVGYLSRKGDLMLKIAMIRSVTLSNDLIITLDHLNWAGDRIEAIEPEMMGAFHRKAPEASGGLNINDVIKHLEGKGTVSLAKLNKHFGIHGHQISTMISPLVDIGKIEVTFDKKTGAEFYRFISPKQA